jgi:mRNA interferase MazF
MSLDDDNTPRRGEVWWIAFDPKVGGEIRKTLPGIVVSNDSANRYLNRVQVVPLTSNVKRLYPAEAYVKVNGVPNKAMADQITTASKRRLREKAGKIDPTDLAGVERAIKTQLGLD